MYVNGKIIPVETVSGETGRGDKGKWWKGRGVEFKYDIVDML
jgi:hypothetical protein